MAGLDASTMQPLDGFDHVMQSIEKIFVDILRMTIFIARIYFFNPGISR